MILVIDNYDSFTFNLVQALEAAGADVLVLRNDAIDRAGLEALADDSATPLRGIVVSPGPGDPIVGRDLRHDDRGRGRSVDPAARGLPRDAVDGGRVRRLDRPRPDPRPRRGVRGDPRRRRAPPRVAAGVHGGALPLAGGRPEQPPRRAPGHGADRGGRGDHGSPAHVAAARGRPVPPRVGAHPGGSASPGELPAAGRRRGGRPARRRRRLVRHRGPRRIGRCRHRAAASIPAPIPGAVVR